MKNFRNQVPGIIGVLGGVILFVTLWLARSEAPGPTNLWLALFVSGLMIFGGAVAWWSAWREGETGGKSGKESTLG